MKCRRFLLSFIIYSLSLIVVSAQGRKIDSLRKAMHNAKNDTDKADDINALSQELCKIAKYDSALDYANKALAISEAIPYRMGCGYAYRIMGLIYRYQGNYSAAMEYNQKALDIFVATGNKAGIASQYSSLGILARKKGDFPKALEYQLKALEIKQGMNDKQSIANTYGSIGVIYDELKDYPKALEYHFKALDIDEKIGDKHGCGQNLANIGSTYFNEGNTQKALEYDLKSLAIDQEIGSPDDITIDLCNIGDVYEAQRMSDKAVECYHKALAISTKIGAKSSIAADYCSLGSVSMDQKKYAMAQKYFDSAMAISLAIGEKEFIKNTYHELTRLDSITHDFKKAFSDYKQYIGYCDSMLNEANTKKTVQSEMNYQFEQKQAGEKAAQDKKDAIASAEKKKQRILTTSVTIGLLLVLMFSGLLFSRFRVTQKQKQIIEEQKEIVEQKNKEVLDSITYAKRLQDAILPPLSVIKKYFPDSFVLYKPKDIVAGDFYWMERTGDNILIAACDCTGHGVPGAMVSVVCSNALNRTVKEFKITEPGKILDKVRELVIETFSQRDPLGEKSESEVQDGMDISLCCINTVTKEIQWSGANNSLWYVQDNELKEVNPDKQPIGRFIRPTPFNTSTLKLKKGDALYLFTDGYTDQFGGPKGKKYMIKQLAEKLRAISGQNMEEQKDLLATKFESWKGNLEQVDDVLIMGIRI